MSRTPELYHLPDEAYTINYFSDTYYEIMFSLKERDDSKPLWKLVDRGELEWYSLLDRIGIEIKYNNGKDYTSYKLRNFYEIERYHNSNEAAYDLDKLHKEIDKLEHKLLWHRFKKNHTIELGNVILTKLKNTIMEIVKVPQNFKITKSMYDSDLHIEFIHFNVKDYSFDVEYHFKSADCDLRGQYKGNKIAFIHYSCGKGRLEHNGDSSEIIKFYTPRDKGYEESYDNLRDFIIEKTGLDKETVNYKIMAVLNQRIDIDTEDFLEHNSHLTQFIYEDNGSWSYKIIASWSKQMLDSLIDSYTNLRSPSTIGAFLINGGLINELKVKVTHNFEPLVDLTIKSPADPDILKVLSDISHTKKHYMPFRRELELFLTKTFSDEVVRLPESVDKILNELNATLTQKKVVADAFKKLS
jgi:hypothetical protein